MEQNKKDINEQGKAAALKYDLEKDAAPRVVASGKGYVADRIVELAKEHGVPLHQDRSLIEILIRLDLGDTIPYELYKAVAEVLAFVYRIESRAKQGRL